MAPLARVCYTPSVMDGSGNATSSHFCGNAALIVGEAWPTCGCCKQAMELFVQLPSSRLPPDCGSPFGEGILQVFYCANYDCDGGPNSWDGFGLNQLTRVLTPETEVVSAARPGGSEFATKVIVGWNTVADYPNSEEAEMHGVSLEGPLQDAFYEHEDGPSPVQGDKLLGWPAWVQNVEYVNCPECGDPMTYVFQIDSERNVPYMFGDCGCAHASICRKHPSRGAFRWACC